MATYPIHWLLNAVENRVEGVETRVAQSLAICSYSNQIFSWALWDDEKTTSETIRPMIIRDLIIENGKCEQGGECLYLQCPYNQTSHKTWKRLNVEWNEYEFEQQVKRRERHQADTQKEIDGLKKESESHCLLWDEPNWIYTISASKTSSKKKKEAQ
jgi:hypothetical protein